MCPNLQPRSFRYPYKKLTDLERGAVDALAQVLGRYDSPPVALEKKLHGTRVTRR